MYIFDSRNKDYKSIISAIKTDQSLKLRILIPRDVSCHGAKLVVTKEGESPAYYSMFWAGMCGDFNEYWELDFVATTSGLYFYHFELETAFGTNYIKNIGRGIGDFSTIDSDFQQTVYDKDYKVPSFLNGGIIYQIFPDRFNKSNKNKENVPTSRVMREWGAQPFWKEEQMNGVWNNDYFGGDLKGIEEKLPYISSLGVSAIYLNPIFEAHSNHRYDTADYEKIDPLLGTQDDFKSLCKKAKKLSISIILDGVFSHTGCNSKYFNMYNEYDTTGAYQSKDSEYFSWYKFTDYEKKKYHSWWGIKLLPEIDEENESYREYICSKNGIARRWLKLGASGWRLDVADELPDVFLDDFRNAVKEENEDAVIIGEVWEDATNKFSYGERRRYLLGNQLDSVMNYPFASAIIEFVRFGVAENFAEKIMQIVENYPKNVLNILMNHIGTHDTARAITMLAGPLSDGKSRYWQHENNVLTPDEKEKGKTLLKLASALQYTLPGVPSLYYGDEIALEGMKDPFNRATMDWNSKNTDILSWYKRLGEIRRGTKAFADGEINFLYSKDKTVVFERLSKNAQALVGINCGDTKLQIEVENWDNSYELLGAKSVDKTLSLSPMSVTILAKQ